MAEWTKILPCAAAASSSNPKDKGWRLRVWSDDGSLVRFREEQVLPERVQRPDANRILATLGEATLTPDEARWLRDVLSEHLDALDKEADHV